MPGSVEFGGVYQRVNEYAFRVYTDVDDYTIKSDKSNRDRWDFDEMCQRQQNLRLELSRLKTKSFNIPGFTANFTFGESDVKTRIWPFKDGDSDARMHYEIEIFIVGTIVDVPRPLRGKYPQTINRSRRELE